MTKGILAVLTISVLVGTLAGVLAGPLPGIGMFAGTAVVGSIAVLLWRKPPRSKGAGAKARARASQARGR